ncbi:MAG: acylneuraminate cytidylyltransferase family protein [Thermodesulfobacteriota bacterium]
MAHPKVTALLPMKGHSERIPNKNIRVFGGKPLFHMVADVLEKSAYVNEIIINTDSDKIAEDALKNFSKAKIHRRPENLCGDFVAMNDIIAYDISQTDGKHFLQTHSTNPLLTLTTMERAMADYFASLQQFDSLFSVTQIQSRLFWESGEPVNHNQGELLRTQDLPTLFEENSNIFLFSKASFTAASNKRIGLKPKMFVMDKLEAIDIDEEDDWIMAETLYRSRMAKKI